MRRLIGAVLLLAVAGEAAAGNNVAGQAWLSWDRLGTSSQIAQAPSTRFSLYLHLAGAPDIKSLGVDVRWQTGDSLGCYSVVSAASELDCGWAVDSLPGGSFASDSSYTWTINFPAPTSKTCVGYRVSASTCGNLTTPVRFWLSSVVTKDNFGAVDSLEVLEQAVIGPLGLPADTSLTSVPGIVLIEFAPGAL